jgi:DnaJ-class molecular chaperone
MSSSPYDVLGVDKSASEQEIKRAYRALTLKYHPDRNSSDEAASKIREINDAYAILSDPNKRRQLAQQQQFRGGMEMDMESPMDIFQMLFAAGGPGMMFHGPELFVDPRFMQQQQRPPPLQQQLTLTLEQAYTGCTLPIEVERWVMHGHIKVQEIETIYVTIPPGIDESEILTLPDKGNVLHDQNKGAVKISIRVENDTAFRRQGLDLVYTKTLTLKEALCGFHFELKHINGKTLAMKNAQTLIKPHFRKTVPNMGMTREQTTGALIIEFDVKFPDALTLEQISALNDIL